MKIHAEHCKTCGKTFQTFLGQYCDTCRHDRLCQAGRERAGIRHKTSHGGSHKPKLMAPAKCPRCGKVHLEEVEHIPKIPLRIFCPKPCAQYVNYYSSGSFAEHRLAL
jgi:hypothetical protein